MTRFLPLFDPSPNVIGRPIKIPEPSHSDDSGTCKVTVNETPIFDPILRPPLQILRLYFDPIWEVFKVHERSRYQIVILTLNMTCTPKKDPHFDPSLGPKWSKKGPKWPKWVPEAQNGWYIFGPDLGPWRGKKCTKMTSDPFYCKLNFGSQIDHFWPFFVKIDIFEKSPNLSQRLHPYLGSREVILWCRDQIGTSEMILFGSFLVILANFGHFWLFWSFWYFLAHVSMSLICRWSSMSTFYLVSWKAINLLKWSKWVPNSHIKIPHIWSLSYVWTLIWASKGAQIPPSPGGVLRGQKWVLISRYLELTKMTKPDILVSGGHFW